MNRIIRRSFVAMALAAVLATLAGCAAEPVRVRVLSYNIHHGEGADGKFDLPRLAAVIKAAEPDLVALQEVDRATKRSSGVDQAAELGKLTGLHAYFANAMDFQGGGYGEAVLSRWPIAEAKTIALPADKGYEPRAAAAVRIVPPGAQAFWFVGTHLDHTDADAQRLRQVDTLIASLVEAEGGPAILAGDLNAEPGSAPMRKLLEHFADAAEKNPQMTWPADDPRMRIDWVLLRPAAGWIIVEARVIDERIASDHRPLLGVLEWVGVPRDAAVAPGRPDTIERLGHDLHRQADRPGRD